MSHLHDTLGRLKGSDSARDVASRAFFALFSWIWVLQILIPWWETWRDESSWTVRLVSTALAAVFIGAYSWCIYRIYFRRWSWTEIFTVRERWLLRGVLASIATLLVIWLGGAWGLALIFVVIAAVLTAPPLQANVAAMWAMVFIAVVLVVAQVETSILLSVLTFSFVFGMIIASLHRQGGRIGEMIEARYTEVRMAAAEERLRIARDLHDVLGHSLSLITLKSELASRLVDADPGRAKQEIREVEQLARSAMGDVRRTVAEDRSPILAAEIGDARQLLEAAGIGLQVNGDTDAFPDDIAALFAWGVREGVTNVVRHSRARRCAIHLWHDGNGAGLSVTDDGAENGTAGSGSGMGIESLRERSEALGGSLSFDVLPDGAGHRLCLTVPASSME